MLTSEVSRRAFAAAWFAAAAIIPVGVDLLINPLSSGTIYRIVTIIAPVLAAGIIGSWLGADILDKTTSAIRAAMRGSAVAALSYLLFFIMELAAVIVYNIGSSGDDIFKLIYVIAIMFGIGLVAIGWLVASVGAAAGALLYQCRTAAVKEKNYE